MNATRSRRASRVLMLASLVTLGCALAGTGGRLVEVELTLMSVAEDGFPLGESESIDADPWHIELLEARLIVGALYLFPPRERLAWLSPLPRARAHGGDDNEVGSNAMAEHLDQVVVDALRGAPVELGPIAAEAGIVDRGSVFLDHPRGALLALGTSGPTRGHLAWVRARATRGGASVEVEAGLAIENTPLRRRVDQIRPNAGAETREGARVIVGLRAGEWLREVDFAALIPPDHDPESGPARVSVSAPSQLHNAFQIALARPTSYTLRVEGSDDEPL